MEAGFEFGYAVTVHDVCAALAGKGYDTNPEGVRTVMRRRVKAGELKKLSDGSFAVVPGNGPEEVAADEQASVAAFAAGHA